MKRKENDMKIEDHQENTKEGIEDTEDTLMIQKAQIHLQESTKRDMNLQDQEAAVLSLKALKDIEDPNHLKNQIKRKSQVNLKNTLKRLKIKLKEQEVREIKIPMQFQQLKLKVKFMLKINLKSR